MRFVLRSVLLLLVLSPLGATTADAGEIFVLGDARSGSYGTETDSDSREARVVYVTGDRFQFRADVSFLSVNSEIGIRPGPGGPLPGGPGGRRESNGGGNGSQGSEGSGGSGSGGDGAGQSGAERSSGTSARSTAETDPGNDPEPISASGLGDVHLAVSHILAGGGAKLHRLDGGLSIKAPTASSDEGLGTGEWDARLGLTGQYRFWSATGFAGVGWNHYGDPEWGQLKDGLDAYLGVESEPLGDRVVLSGWLEGNPEIVAGVGSRVAVGLGLRTTGKARWRLMTTLGLTDAAEDFGVVFGVSTGVRTPFVGTRGARR